MKTLSVENLSRANSWSLSSCACPAGSCPAGSFSSWPIPAVVHEPANSNRHAVYSQQYPYYAKYIHQGDGTFFRHIDLNVGDLASSDRGANMIRETVSLDNEKEDDCTMILPGMHKHIKEWNEVLTERGLSLVHHTQDSMFTSEDEKRFDTKWTPQPC